MYFPYSSNCSAMYFPYSSNCSAMYFPYSSNCSGIYFLYEVETKQLNNSSSKYTFHYIVSTFDK